MELYPLLFGVIGALVWLAVWQWFTTWGPLKDTFGLPSATEVLAATFGQATEVAFWIALGVTLLQSIGAMAIVIAVGVTLGVAMGLYTPVRAMTDPTTQAFRAIPAIVVLPLLLLVYGPTTELAIALAVFGGIWPIVIQAESGVRSTDPVMLETAKVIRLSWVQTQMHIVLPSALPFIATGVRIAASLILMLTIGAGILGGSPGLGKTIMIAQQTGNSSLVFALLLWAGGLGLGLNAVLGRIERLVARPNNLGTGS